MSTDTWDWYDDRGWEDQPDAHRVTFDTPADARPAQERR